MQSVRRLVFALFGLLVAAATAQSQDNLLPEVKALLDRALAGDADSQLSLALAYEAGRGAPRDASQAMRWYLAAANQGHPEAQNSVGSVLQVEKKFAEARPWYEKAAAQRHALATNNLAYLYDLGLGVAQDRQQAFRLYSRAADLGWAEAMWNLANMYGAGQLDGPPDLLQACIWTFRASRFALPREQRLQMEVRRVTPILERRLSSVEMRTCREQSESWAPPEAGSRADRSRPATP
jgi:TPR repeat protein